MPELLRAFFAKPIELIRCCYYLAIPDKTMSIKLTANLSDNDIFLLEAYPIPAAKSKSLYGGAIW